MIAMLRQRWWAALALVAIVLSWPGAVAAQSQASLWPDATYDPAIPPMKTVLGHEPGERIVSPAEALRYLEALQSAAPKRLRIVEYGRTWEHRPLVYVVIGSEKNLARLDAIKQGMASLADPRRTDGSAADALIRDLPAVVWLGYGIHGDEISSTDAALYTAYHLLAARDDEVVRTALESALVIIDPRAEPRRPRPLRVLQPRRGRQRAVARARSRPSTISRGPAAAATTTCSISTAT